MNAENPAIEQNFDPVAEEKATGVLPILVLGMHRSGTSAIARILGMMGAYLGEADELLPAHPQDNPKGYWELSNVVSDHDDVLISAGYEWDRLAGFDFNNIDVNVRAKFSAKVQETVARMKRKKTSWVVKDPRLCLLVPQWLETLDKSAFVFVVRDPRIIVSSLIESPRGTYTADFLIALWEKYVRAALSALHGRDVLFVSYDHVVNAPELENSRICFALSAMGAHDLHLAENDQLRDFVDPQLRRSVAQSHWRLSESQDALTAWLVKQQNASGAVRVADYPMDKSSDAILLEFEKSMDSAALGHNGALRASEKWREYFESEVSNSLAGVNQELEASKALVQTMRADSNSLICAIEERDGKTVLLQAELLSMEELASQHSRENESLRQRVADLTVSYEELHQEKIRLNSEIDRQSRDLLEMYNMREEISARDQRIGQMSQTIDAQQRNTSDLTTHAAALEQSLKAMRNSLSWKLTAPARFVAEFLTLRMSWSLEQGLYRAYYGIPGISAARKRAFILWLHDHAKWLTRHTMSYQLRERARQYKNVIDASGRTAREPRMDAERAATILKSLRKKPLISIAMPVYNIDARWLLLAVDSVRRQFYGNWEFCIADDASTKPETLKVLDDLARENDRRIKIVRLKKNVGIALASNAALELATGEFVGLLDHDDELTRDALLEMARVIDAENPDLIYSDEDKTDESNERRDPFFKPDYSPEYFLTNNYLCHFTILRATILKDIGGFRTGVDGAQDFDLFLRFTANAKRIAHIPKVLYHWRMITGSTAATASAKPYTWEAGRKALQYRLDLENIAACAEQGPYPNTYRIRYQIHGEPLVSILVPFRDKAELLDVCVRSILDLTDYKNFEIIGIDNGSVDPQTQKLKETLTKLDARVRFISYDQPFNYSAINNFGAAHALGEHLLLLNNDTEVLSPEWLRSMLEHSQRPEVGVVGAKLLYPDNTIQHAGVILDRNVVAMHPHQFLPVEHPGYAARPHLLQNLSAVTFACAMTRRDVFEKLSGLNETDLPICFNDVDYCLRARESGYLVVFTPYAVLRHFESKSRGFDEGAEKIARFRTEFDFMQKRHRAILSKGDPYYNPNLSLGIQGGFHADPHYAEELPL